MSDQFEVKQVTKSGDDYNIRIGPKDSPDGMLAFIVCAIITVAAMNMFGLYGFGWAIGLWLFFVVLMHFFPVIISSIAGLIVVSVLVWAIFF